MPTPSTAQAPLEEIAGNGLLHRRAFLTHGMALIGAAGLISGPPVRPRRPTRPPYRPGCRRQERA